MKNQFEKLLAEGKSVQIMHAIENDPTPPIRNHMELQALDPQNCIAEEGKHYRIRVGTSPSEFDSKNFRYRIEELPNEIPEIMPTDPFANLPGRAMCIDTGIRYKRAEPKRRQRPLTTEECNKLFGIELSVKMNFIPQMLTALALDQTLKLVDYCRVARVSEVKKHTRVLKTAVETYVKKLKESYGSAFRAYQRYTDRFDEETMGEVWKMEMYADTLCKNQVPNVRHHYICIRALMIVMLIDFSQDYDKEMDKVIAKKIGQPVKQRPDICIMSISAMCKSMAEDFGYKIEPDQAMSDWIKVLRNKASFLADKILREEGYVK